MQLRAEWPKEPQRKQVTFGQVAAENYNKNIKIVRKMKFFKIKKNDNIEITKKS